MSSSLRALAKQSQRSNLDFSAIPLKKITLKAGNIDAASYLKFQAFTTAAVHEEKIRNRIKAALVGNVKRGESYKDFAKVLNNTWTNAGFRDKSKLENIYKTNKMLAYGAGQQAKMIEHQDTFPYWKYSAIMDKRTRRSHKALHGKIFKANDHHFYPPLGFRCRCTAIPLTKRQVETENKKDFVDENQKEDIAAELQNAEFIGNKQEKFIRWVESQYNTAEPETKTLIESAVKFLKENMGFAKQIYSNNNSTGIVIEHYTAKIAPDYDRNLIVAKELADFGYKVEIREYINAQNHKNPEYIVNGLIADLKEGKNLQGLNTKTAIDNAIKDSSKQGVELPILRLGNFVNKEMIFDRLKGRFHLHKNIKSIILIRNQKQVLINRESFDWNVLEELY